MDYLLSGCGPLIWSGIGFVGWLILWKKVAVNFQYKAALILGFIFVVFFGLVSLILAVIAPPMQVCPYCSSFIRKSALVCPHCQRDLVG